MALRSETLSTVPFAASIVALAAFGSCADSAPVEHAVQQARADAPAPSFVDESLCAGCHAEIASLWQGSHHDLAMQEVSPATVLGDFAADGDPPGPAEGFRQTADTFVFSAQNASGELEDFEVEYVFGVEPLQQYLASTGGGRLQCMTTAWDTRKAEWFALYPDADFPPGDALHWTGTFQNWNTMCAECHSTGLVKGYDAERDTFETTWEQIDVGCQACHGPGSDHVAWAEGEREGQAVGLVNIAKGPGGAQLDACARCHSRRANLRPAHAHGTPFLDGYFPERLHDGLYHADGQILDEVYVYGSFVQSRMHAAGVSCTDCHEAHTLELLTPGNSLCTQCHSEHAPLERFPTLQAKRYDDPSHHFHETGSEGAACVECHMPSRTYMQVDPRRDHSFRIPRPDQTVSLGVPNACSNCHAEHDAQWAADQLSEWYGPKERRSPEFAETLAAARAGRDVSVELARLSADTDAPAIVRATAVDLLPLTDGAQLDALRSACGDADGLVRASAGNALDRLPGALRLELGVPLLDDPLRSVRVAAARSLSGAPPEALPSDEARRALSSALEEYREARGLALDTPAGWLNLGVDRQSTGDPEGAVRAYERALRMDRAFLPATFNLATLLSATERSTQALGVIESALELSPNEGELYFSLGLLRGELGDLEGAAQALEQAARLAPNRQRVHYNLGLVLWQLARLDEAEARLQLALSRNPGDIDVLNSLARVYLELGEKELALGPISELERLLPQEPWVSELRRAAR